MDFQKAWNRKRLKTYLITILSVFGCAYLLQAFLLLHENRWYLFLIAAALIAVAVLTVLLSRKKEQNTELSGADIVVDRNMATNKPGCFAAGDCTGRPYQLTKAVGEGNVAAHSIVAYLAEKEA